MSNDEELAFTQVDCPLCSSNENSTFLRANDMTYKTNGTYTLTRCSCGLVFLNPRPNSKLLSDHNTSVYRSPTGLIGKLLFRSFESLKKALYSVERLPRGAGRKILDVGCGGGSYLKYAQDKGWIPYGVDISPVSCESTRKRVLYPENILNVELAQAKWKNDYFDHVSMIHVLEHISNPLGLLREINKVLKPQGILFVEVPNLDSLEFQLFREKWVYLSAPRHLNHFTTQTLTKILNKAGFRVIEISFPITIPLLFSGSLINSIKTKLLDRYRLGIGVRTTIITMAFFPFMVPILILSSKIRKGSAVAVKAIRS